MPYVGNIFSVLLIAGDQASHILCRTIFSFYQDIKFLEAFNPKEGWQRAEIGDIDLVITDVEFPDYDLATTEDYFQMMRLNCPLTKFSICSERRDEKIIAHYIKELGAADYFFKPLDMKALIKKVFDLFEKPYPEWMQKNPTKAKDTDWKDFLEIPGTQNMLEQTKNYLAQHPEIFVFHQWAQQFRELFSFGMDKVGSAALESLEEAECEILKGFETIRAIALTGRGMLSTQNSSREDIYFKTLWRIAKGKCRLADVKTDEQFSDYFIIYGNTFLVKKLFVSLTQNALEAMGEQPMERKIQLECSYKEMEGKLFAHFVYRDNSFGIIPETLAYKHNLYICRHIVEWFHRGKFEIKNKIGRGITCIFRLPMKPVS